MRRLLAVVVVVLVVIGVVGFSRGWFHVSGDNDHTTMDVNLSVDKTKVKADEQKAREKIEQLKDRAGNGLQGATQRTSKEPAAPGSDKE